MTKLQILGTGCPKCHQLTENTKAAAEALGMDYQIEKITQITEITKFGVMMTPALAVDGQVKSSGKLLDIDTIKTLIQG